MEIGKAATQLWGQAAGRSSVDRFVEQIFDPQLSNMVKGPGNDFTYLEFAQLELTHTQEAGDAGKPVVLLADPVANRYELWSWSTVTTDPALIKAGNIFNLGNHPMFRPLSLVVESESTTVGSTGTIDGTAIAGITTDFDNPSALSEKEQLRSRLAVYRQSRKLGENNHLYTAYKPVDVQPYFSNPGDYKESIISQYSGDESTLDVSGTAAHLNLTMVDDDTFTPAAGYYQITGDYYGPVRVSGSLDKSGAWASESIQFRVLREVPQSSGDPNQVLTVHEVKTGTDNSSMAFEMIDEKPGRIVNVVVDTSARVALSAAQSRVLIEFQKPTLNLWTNSLAHGYFNIGAGQTVTFELRGVFEYLAGADIELTRSMNQSFLPRSIVADAISAIPWASYLGGGRDSTAHAASLGQFSRQLAKRGGQIYTAVDSGLTGLIDALEVSQAGLRGAKKAFVQEAKKKSKKGKGKKG